MGIDKSYNNNNHFIYFIDTHVTPSPPSMRAGTDLQTATTLAATSQGNKQASNSSSGSSGSGSEKRCLACKRLIVFAYRLGEGVKSNDVLEWIHKESESERVEERVRWRDA